MKKQNYSELISLKKKVGLLGSVSELLGWDQEVNMPPKAAEIRAQEQGVVAELHHQLFIDPKIGKLIKNAKKEKLTKKELANLNEIEYDYKKAKKIQSDLVVAFAHTSAKALEVWKEAREKNDFNSFTPWLNKTVKLNKKYAKIINKKRDPFEVVFEDYEKGINVKEVDVLFNKFKEEIVPLIEKITSIKKIKNNLSKKKIPVDKQKEISLYVAKLIGYDFSKGRLDESTHPFTSCYGRITTRYNEGWISAILSTIHEAGHGMYEHNLPIKHYGTPLGQSRSLSIHESQSRYYENHIGRSKEFWKKILNKVKKTYDINISLDEMYKLINIVEPSFIRVEADELTYSLHIILRYELEKDLINNRIKINEIPKIWNAKMKKYLGIVPKSDSVGCLQDVHWAMGGLGYFPTYTLGSMIAAQLNYKMKSEIPNYNKKIEKGDFKEINLWLNKNIHSLGCQYSTQELIKKATGEKLNVKYYINYLTEKFTKLYNL